MGKEIVRISLSGVCKSGGRTVEATTRVRVSARGDPGRGGGTGRGRGVVQTPHSAPQGQGLVGKVNGNIFQILLSFQFK